MNKSKPYVLLLGAVLLILSARTYALEYLTGKSYRYLTYVSVDQPNLPEDVRFGFRITKDLHFVHASDDSWSNPGAPGNNWAYYDASHKKWQARFNKENTRFEISSDNWVTVRGIDAVTYLDWDRKPVTVTAGELLNK